MSGVSMTGAACAHEASGETVEYAAPDLLGGISWRVSARCRQCGIWFEAADGGLFSEVM